MENTTPLWPLVVYFGAVIVVVLGMLATVVLGERHRDRAIGEPYESGIKATGSARQRLSAYFYLVAMIFVIFDLEVAFLIAWAISFRATGWGGFIGALIFIGILIAALVYEWRMGILDWISPEQERAGTKTTQ